MGPAFAGEEGGKKESCRRSGTRLKGLSPHCSILDRQTGCSMKNSSCVGSRRGKGGKKKKKGARRRLSGAVVMGPIVAVRRAVVARRRAKKERERKEGKGGAQDAGAPFRGASPRRLAQGAREVRRVAGLCREERKRGEEKRGEGGRRRRAMIYQRGGRRPIPLDAI